MKDASIPVVWTLFFGDQARTLTAVLCLGEENGSHLLTLCQPERQRQVIGGPRKGTLIQISIPHPAILQHYHILLFDGYIPPGGVNTKVLRLTVSFEGSDRVIASVNRSCARRIPSGEDFACSVFLPPYRQEVDSRVTQQMRFQILAIPKSTRILILTFHDRSLQAWYRMVRASANTLGFETANSY